MLTIPLDIQKFASTSGTCPTNVEYDSKFRVEWQQTSQSTSSNSTNINWQLYADLGHSFGSNAIKVNYVDINGQRVHGGGTWSNLSKGTHTLAAGSMTIPHNADGTKIFNISLSGWLYSNHNYSGSVNFELNKIPRYAHTDSANGDNIENPFKVNYTKYVNNYTYKLRVSLPRIETLETIDYNTSGSEFTLTKESIEKIYDKYPETNTFNLGFAVETYNNESKVSDGNEITIQATKTDRIARLRMSDEWKRAVPHIRVNGEWKKAVPYTRINNEWKRGK